MEPQETTERVEQVEQVASNTEGRMKMLRRVFLGLGVVVLLMVAGAAVLCHHESHGTRIL